MVVQIAPLLSLIGLLCWQQVCESGKMAHVPVAQVVFDDISSLREKRQLTSRAVPLEVFWTQRTDFLWSTFGFMSLPQAGTSFQGPMGAVRQVDGLSHKGNPVSQWWKSAL